MRRRIFRWRWVALSTLVLVVLLQAAIFSRTLQDSVLLGAYDPARTFEGAEAIAIDHHFVTWRRNDTSELQAALQQSVSNHHLPMITLESWPWNWNGLTDETLLKDIINGRYDPTFAEVFKVLETYSYQTILFRWGHEMEITGQYPWSKAEAEDYIAAYRHIFEMGHQVEASHLLWMWSPAGNDNARDFWPGDAYVDCVGVSIYAHPKWNEQNYGELPSFQQLMEKKYWPASEYDKPMLVAEVGVEGSVAEQNSWLSAAIESLPNFSKINAWVYFNQQQPPIVPLDIGLPHWEVSEDTAELLTTRWQASKTSLESKINPLPL